MSIVNGTVTTKTEGGVTYGISISDLQKATNSAKRDLMLLHCESVNGLGIESEEEGITNGTQTIKSAFSLRDMPLPNGWSRLNNVTSKKGDLVMHQNDLTKEIAVSKPRWNIWADNVNFGKFVMKDASNNYHFEYNIFQPLNGVGMPNLQQWQGYNPNNVHEPKVSLSSNMVSMEFHNGVYAPLTNQNKMFPTDTSRAKADNYCVWVDPQTELAKGTCAIGNLIDWDFNRAHSTRCAVVSSDNKSYDFSNDNGIDVYGVAIEVNEAGETTSPHRIARAYKTQSSVLKYGVSQALKDEYRNGVEVGLEYASQFGGSLYGRFLTFYKAGASSLPARASLSMVLSNIGEGQGSVAGSNMVDTSWVLGNFPMTINAVFDTKISNATLKNTRVILTSRSVQSIDSYVCVNDGSGFLFIQPSKTTTAGKGLGGFCIPLYFWQNNNIASGDDISALVELCSVSSGTPTPTEYRRVYRSATRFIDLPQESPFHYDRIGDLTDGIVLPNGKKWANYQTSDTSYQYVASENVKVIYINNADLYNDPNTTYNLSDNTTATITLYDRHKCVTIDVLEKAVSFLYSTPSRCPVTGTYNHGYFMFLGNRYVASNNPYSHIWELDEQSSSTVSYSTDFLRYDTPTSHVTNSDLSSMNGMKVAIYNNGTKIGDIPLTYYSATNLLTGQLTVGGKLYSARISEGDIRTAATIDGALATSMNVCTLELGLPVSNTQRDSQGNITKESDNIRFDFVDNNE